MTSFPKQRWRLVPVMCEKLHLAFANDIKGVSGGSLSADEVAVGVVHLRNTQEMHWRIMEIEHMWGEKAGRERERKKCISSPADAKYCMSSSEGLAGSRPTPAC